MNDTASKRILLIQGHPDPEPSHLCDALCQAYRQGALGAGHQTRDIDVAQLQFPLLRTQQEWATGTLPDSLRPAQEAIRWAQHIVIFFPLWLGDMPALLKGFLEQVARPDFAFAGGNKNPMANKALRGRSARVVVTMGMPAVLYRWYFRAHSVKSLERNILGLVGIAPVDETLIGGVGDLSDDQAAQWLSKLERLGREAR